MSAHALLKALLCFFLPFSVAQDFHIGSFVVSYTNETGQVAVFHQDSPSTTLWLSRQPFVSVDFIKEKTHQRDGTIYVDEVTDDKNWPSCSDQTVLSVEYSQQDSTLRIKGELCMNHKNVKTAISYLMSFGVHPDSSYQLAATCEVFGFPQQMLFKPHLTLSYATSPDERFFGLGEQYTYLDLKGQVVPLITREKGTGRGLQPITWIMNRFYNHGGGSAVSSYMAIPFYLTSHLSALYFTNTEYMVFDLDSSNSSRVAVTTNATAVAFTLIGRSSFLDIISEYTTYSGRMKPLPEWVNRGAIVGLEFGTEAVMQRMEQLKAVAPDMPVAGVWFQDWSGLRTFVNRVGLWWNWELDTTLYHDWPMLQSYFQNYSPNGVKILTYVNPMLANTSAKKTPTAHNYKQIAQDAGYLVKEAINDKGKTAVWNGYGEAGLLDLTNPKARQFFKALIKDNMLALNISGWMADFGESYPLGAVAFDPHAPSAATYHNMYPTEWQQLNREVVEEMGVQDEVLYFCRSGAAKSPGVTSSFWVGDQLVTWDKFDGLKAAMTAMLTLGLSGFSLTHSDTGGYVMINLPVVKYALKYVRTKQLFWRWTELSAFTAIYRTHPGTLPDSSWQFYSDNSTILQYSKFAKVYASLADYRQELMQEAYQKGYPLMRPMFLHYPEDPVAFTLQYQYMLGSEFLVAPVMDENATTVEVYLPAGTWINVWTNRSYSSAQGHFIDEDAPLGQPGVFHRGGSEHGTNFIGHLKKWGIV